MKGETVTSWFKFYGPFILIVFITIGWGVFFYFVSPEVIIEKIGLQNSYIVAFIISAICGFSSITSTTFYVTIGALAKGGANPLLLGIAGGLGVCLSDFVFFYIISKGTTVIDKHWKKLTDFMKRMIAKMPEWLLFVFVFAYSGFFPAPNDILLVGLAFSGIPFKKIMPYLFAGDIVSTLLIAYLLK
jgi:hypothetical protein